MDCEKFESAMLDELYGELDELTSAAAKRHIAGCSRCSARIVALRATRRMATVRLVDPPADLEDRILAAADRAWTAAPRRPRLAHWISLAGSWAMLPQNAMAAVFLVMIGTSVLLLRGKSERADSGRVTVTEQGTPAPAMSAPTAVGRPEPAPSPSPVASVAPDQKPAPAWNASAKAPPATTAPPGSPGAGPPAVRAAAESKSAGGARADPDDESAGAPFDAAVQSYRAGRFDVAAREFDALAPGDPNSALWAARSVRDGQGCAAAVGRFDKTARQARQSPPGWDALLEAGLCYRQLGDFGTARARLGALLGVDSHKDRARAELARIDQLQPGQANSDTFPAKAGARTRITAAPAPPVTAAPAARPPAASEADH